MTADVYQTEFTVSMHDILFLHGFGETQPEDSKLAKTVKSAVPGCEVFCPCYHPAKQIADTRIGKALEDLVALISRSHSGKVGIVGYSFGALLAGWLAEKRPDLISNVLLLAPAIDNLARNYEGRDPSSWKMPKDYVDELRTYSARPRIVRPTTLVHGLDDDDNGGSEPSRIREWAEAQSFRSIYMLSGVNHKLDPWLSGEPCKNEDSSNAPTIQQLVIDLFSN